MIKKLKVFAPASITGFFEICDHEDPRFMGSRGAGVTLDDGVVTQTTITHGDGNISIKYNGKESGYDNISRTAIDIVVDSFSLDVSCIDILVEHECSLPISAGFGTSAGFAEGVCYTLPKLLGVNLTFKEAGELAHLSELRQSTGLGDVVSSIYGGCVIRLREGSPINAVIDKIETTSPIYVISKTVGLLSTKDIIENPSHKKRINRSGSHLLNQLLKNPDLENLMKLSRRFASNSNLITKEVNEILEIFDEENIGSSMAMLGNTAFALSYTPDSPVEGCNVSKINCSGLKYL